MPIWKSTVELYFDVENEAEACDATAELLREHLRHFNFPSCLIDWNHARQYGGGSPTIASPDEIAGLEYDIEGNVNEGMLRAKGEANETGT